MGCDDADRDAHQAKAAQDTIAISTGDIAALPVLGIVKLEYLFVERADQRAADHLGALGRAQDRKIITADMADRVIGGAMRCHHALDDACDEKNRLIAARKPVDIVES